MKAELQCIGDQSRQMYKPINICIMEVPCWSTSYGISMSHILVSAPVRKCKKNVIISFLKMLFVERRWYFNCKVLCKYDWKVVLYIRTDASVAMLAMCALASTQVHYMPVAIWKLHVVSLTCNLQAIFWLLCTCARAIVKRKCWIVPSLLGKLKIVLPKTAFWINLLQAHCEIQPGTAFSMLDLSFFMSFWPSKFNVPKKEEFGTYLKGWPLQHPRTHSHLFT